MQPFPALRIVVLKGNVYVSKRMDREYTAKVDVEGVTAIVGALFLLSAATMDPHISVDIAVTLLVAAGIYRVVRRQKQEKMYSND